MYALAFASKERLHSTHYMEGVKQTQKKTFYLCNYINIFQKKKREKTKIFVFIFGNRLIDILDSIELIKQIFQVELFPNARRKSCDRELKTD